MLGGIRAAQATWLGKALTTLVFGVILLAFVIWGMGDPFRGGSANTVAQVGDVSISTAEYRRAYEVALQDLERRARRAITNEEAHRIGLDVQVLTRLMSNAVLDNEAGRMGLAISDQQVAKGIAADPSFAGPSGAFDRARFNAALREAGLTEQGFIAQQRQTDLRRELVGAMVDALDAPAAAVEALHRYEAETRSLDDVVLTAAAVGEIPPPDDAALQAYYDAHKAAFMAPQYRKIVMLAVTAGTLAKPDQVSDADVAALYDKVKAARFTTPEKRAVTQIVFDTEAQAAALTARIKAGASFDDAVKAENLQDKTVDLGTVGEDQIIDPAVAKAAFALPPDGTSDPVNGRFGFVVVHVGAVEPVSVKPLADVAATLRTEIADSRASAAVKTLQAKVEEARSAGRSVSESAAAAGLEPRTIEAVDAAGLGKDGKPVPDIPDAQELLRAAFASDTGVDNDTISTPDGGSIWYEVAAIEPARQLTLAEARPKVEEAWRAEETAKRLDAKAAGLAGEIDSGQQTIEGIASSLGLAVQHVADAKRSGATGLDAATLAKVFDAKVGTAGWAATGPATRVLFKVIDSLVPVLDPEAPETKQLAARYGTALQDGIINAYLAVMGTKLGAKVNQAALQAATSTGY